MAQNPAASSIVRAPAPFVPEDAAGQEPVVREYSIAAVDRALDLLEALARIGPASLAELAHENRLASSGGDGVKQPSPSPLSLAGFELTTVGRF